MTPQKLEILLVEDNRGDVILFKTALDHLKIDYCLHVADDGMKAMEFLSCPRAEDAHQPDVVVLDLNLPRMPGEKVVSQMLADPLLQRMPLVILTSSQHDQKLLDDWRHDRCAYLIKPSTFAGLVDHVRTIQSLLTSLSVAD